MALLPGLLKASIPQTLLSVHFLDAFDIPLSLQLDLRLSGAYQREKISLNTDKECLRGFLFSPP